MMKASQMTQHQLNNQIYTNKLVSLLFTFFYTFFKAMLAFFDDFTFFQEAEVSLEVLFETT